MQETPVFNLNPTQARQRSLTDVYRVKVSEHVPASDEYVAHRQDGKRPLQWHIVWEALSFRFEDHPDENPLIHRSVNLTDRNGQPAIWGDPTNPEPGNQDSFPIQLSKYFARCGVSIGSDPSVIEGMAFVCERKILHAGKAELQVLVPVQLLDGFVAPDTPRIISVRNSRTNGGNGSPTSSAPPSATRDDALTALAAAMDGRKLNELLNIALSHEIVRDNGEVLAMVAQRDPALEALRERGTVDEDDVFHSNGGA